MLVLKTALIIFVNKFRIRTLWVFCAKE